MIAAMSKKGYGETARTITQTRLEKFVAPPLQIDVTSPLAGRSIAVLVGWVGWRASCNSLKSPSAMAYKKSDGGHKLRATCSERIRAKRRYPKLLWIP